MYAHSDIIQVAGVVGAFWVGAVISRVSPKQRDSHATLILFLAGVLTIILAFADNAALTRGWYNKGQWHYTVLNCALIGAYIGCAVWFVISATRAKGYVIKAEQDATSRVTKAEQDATSRVTKVEQELAAISASENARIAGDKRRVVADEEWSAEPFRHIKVSPFLCDINTDARALTVRIQIVNNYALPRHVWVVSNIAVYRDGVDAPMLFRIALPVMSGLVPANDKIDAHSPWSAMMSREQADMVVAAKHLGGIQVALLDTKITTLVNLSKEPTTATTELPFQSSSVPVRYVHGGE